MPSTEFIQFYQKVEAQIKGDSVHVGRLFYYNPACRPIIDKLFEEAFRIGDLSFGTFDAERDRKSRDILYCLQLLPDLTTYETLRADCLSKRSFLHLTLGRKTGIFASTALTHIQKLFPGTFSEEEVKLDPQPTILSFLEELSEASQIEPADIAEVKGSDAEEKGESELLPSTIGFFSSPKSDAGESMVESSQELDDDYDFLEDFYERISPLTL